MGRKSPPMKPSIIMNHKRARRIKPEIDSSDVSIGQLRNEALAQRAEKQAEHDKKKHESRSQKSHSDKKKKKRKHKHRSHQNSADSNRSSNTSELRHDDPAKLEKVKKKQDQNTPLTPLKPSISAEEISVGRWDAVVATVIAAQIIGCLAITFEAIAYAGDQHWNKVIRGEAQLEQIPGHEVFHKKTYNLENHNYLKKARDYATRDENQEILFIAFIVIYVGVSMIHICTCYIRFADLEQFSTLLITIYALGGAMCMFCSTFLISSVSNIENNYIYAADMLYNFQHIFDNEPPAPATSCDPNDKVYRKGCETYEYSKNQAKDLEAILRFCGDGSRYTRYYSSDRKSTPGVTIQNEAYDRTDLKSLGFCTHDGYKMPAALFAVIMGLISAIVPVIYCCEGNSVFEETPPTIDEDVKQLPTPLPKKLPGKFNPGAAIRQFKAYVEKESDEDEKDAVARPRETFQF